MKTSRIDEEKNAMEKTKVLDNLQESLKKIELLIIYSCKR